MALKHDFGKPGFQNKVKFKFSHDFKKFLQGSVLLFGVRDAMHFSKIVRKKVIYPCFKRDLKFKLL